jgi:uncharacterized protein (UPF0264 family)
MASHKDFVEALKDGLLELGKQELGEHVDALVKDGQSFVEQVEEDLRGWMRQLAAGEMSEAGLRMALAGKADLAKMKALTQMGLTEIRVDKLRQGVLDAVVAAATKTFLA